jgi:hypothetical protein
MPNDIEEAERLKQIEMAKKMEDGGLKKQDDKLSHIFGRKKNGAMKRFIKEYESVRNDIVTAQTADSLARKIEIEVLMKSNQALAHMKVARAQAMAHEAANAMFNEVFSRYRAELNRIMIILGGYPQEDGNVVFPDGSVAKMPKGLYVPAELRYNLGE